MKKKLLLRYIEEAVNIENQSKIEFHLKEAINYIKSSNDDPEELVEFIQAIKQAVMGDSNGSGGSKVQALKAHIAELKRDIRAHSAKYGDQANAAPVLDKLHYALAKKNQELRGLQKRKI